MLIFSLVEAIEKIFKKTKNRILIKRKMRKEMKEISKDKKRVITYIDKNANEREKWIKKNWYYYKDLKKFFKNNIQEKSSVLEIGCGTGYILNSQNPKIGVGIDISNEMIRIAKSRYKHLIFLQMDAENITLKRKFDYIIISDSLGYFEDVQGVFREIKKVSTPDTRIIITYHNFLWQPILRIAELLKLKMPPIRLNWLNFHDISNMLILEGFEIIRNSKRLIYPKYFLIFSWFLNKYIAHLPFFNKLCVTEFIIAKQAISKKLNNKIYSVSVVIPARNETSNIENAVKRIPQMGKYTEIIFVEGHSKDKTLDEIKRVCKKYSKKLDIKFTIQDGEGKGDAVRKGFSMAKGDILMILDADLTVPPEQLPNFYNAIVSGKVEFISGSRLVYPMEKEAMRMLNIFGNKLFSIMFTWLLEQRIKDTLCGTKVISKKNYKKIVANRKYFGEFDPFGDFDLIFGAAKLNLKIAEIPIRYKAREYGSTNISRFRHGWLLLKMVIFAMNKIKFI